MLNGCYFTIWDRRFQLCPSIVHWNLGYMADQMNFCHLCSHLYLHAAHYHYFRRGTLGARPLMGLHLLLNWQYFAKIVENIFALSFLVKDTSCTRMYTYTLIQIYMYMWYMYTMSLYIIVRWWIIFYICPALHSCMYTLSPYKCFCKSYQIPKMCFLSINIFYKYCT